MYFINLKCFIDDKYESKILQAVIKAEILIIIIS
jgi:hypothetical protein